MNSHTLTIGCLGGKSIITPEEINIQPGDTLTFQLATGEQAPGAYAVVVVPDERLADASNQLLRIYPGESKTITTNTNAPAESWNLIIYTEKCGLLIPDQDGFENTTGGPPIIITN